MSARSTISVFAAEMSSPASTIVVHTSTSASPRTNSIITFSSEPSAIWPCATDARGRLLDRVDAVVQEERLAISRELPFDRLLDELLVVLADVGAHRAAALGRRLDHADVAQPGERHLERARDRRRGQRQHVDAQLQLAQQLLLLHAEALLLVDDQQAELLRAHVAGEQAVGAYEDVDLALLEALDRLVHLLGRAEARGHLD